MLRSWAPMKLKAIESKPQRESKSINDSKSDRKRAAKGIKEHQ
ncbi:hypothetical protein [Alkalihalobacillus sp. 1P02AB]